MGREETDAVFSLQEGNKQRNRLIDLLIYSCVALVADMLMLYLIWEWWLLW